jgi:hypothetical protein
LVREAAKKDSHDKAITAHITASIAQAVWPIMPSDIFPCPGGSQAPRDNLLVSWFLARASQDVTDVARKGCFPRARRLCGKRCDHFQITLQTFLVQ